MPSNKSRHREIERIRRRRQRKDNERRQLSLPLNDPPQPSRTIVCFSFSLKICRLLNVDANATRVVHGGHY